MLEPGTATHGFDKKRFGSAGGFIHGFRYTALLPQIAGSLGSLPKLASLSMVRVVREVWACKLHSCFAPYPTVLFG